jgi:hypothetical protein
VRFACLLLLLLVLGAVGCGGGASPQPSAHRVGIPRALAQGWAQRASAIAAAASAGNDCLALRLAGSLRSDVLASEHRVPLRLRSPLVTGVDSLAASLTCTETVTVETTPAKSPAPKPGPGPHKPKPPHKPPPPHHPPGHDEHHGPGGGKPK